MSRRRARSVLTTSRVFQSAMLKRARFPSSMTTPAYICAEEFALLHMLFRYGGWNGIKWNDIEQHGMGYDGVIEKNDTYRMYDQVYERGILTSMRTSPQSRAIAKVSTAVVSWALRNLDRHQSRDFMTRKATAPIIMVIP